MIIIHIAKKRTIAHILIFVFPILMFGCTSKPIDVSKIEISRLSVLDSNFHEVRVIDQRDQLREINELWRQVKPIDKLPNTNWTHKFDIQATHLSGRWLYNKQGYLAMLNYQLTPMYRVDDPTKFNRVVLGEKDK